MVTQRIQQQKHFTKAKATVFHEQVQCQELQCVPGYRLVSGTAKPAFFVHGPGVEINVVKNAFEYDQEVLVTLVGVGYNEHRGKLVV